MLCTIKNKSRINACIGFILVENNGCKINRYLLPDSPCLLNFEKETVNNENFDVSNILNN